MRFCILSLFPEYFESPFKTSIIGRAIKKGLIEISCVDIRTYAEGKHSQVDDRPYGGGPGMVLMAEPVVKAIRDVKKKGSHVIYLSPQGTPLSNKRCQELAEYDDLVLVCGHYEGIDERALALEVDEEISVGDYILPSGCAPAVIVTEAVARFKAGVVGNEESAYQDSFSRGIFDAPHYTRPDEFEGIKVPQVLMNGNHAEIAAWRDKQARDKTERVRPDLTRSKSNEQKCDH